MRIVTGTVVSLLAALGVAGCTYSSATLDEVSCQEPGAREAGRECRDGLWVAVAPLADMAGGLDMPPVDMSPVLPGDMSEPDMRAPDMCGELDEQAACAGRCGLITASHCGQELSISCAPTCGAGQVCEETVCEEIMCTALDQAVFCEQRTCGEFVVPEGFCAQGELRACGSSCGFLKTCEIKPDDQASGCVCVSEPEDVLRACTQSGVYCGQTLTANACSLPCDYCPFDDFTTSELLVMGGPYVRPLGVVGTIPWDMSTEPMIWLDGNRGVELGATEPIWRSMFEGAGMGELVEHAKFSAGVSLTPGARATNFNAMVAFTKEAYAQFERKHNGHQLTLVMAFRAQTPQAAVAGASWEGYPTLAGGAVEMSENDFGLAMDAMGGLVWGHEEKSEESLVLPGMWDDGRVHILALSRGRQSTVLRIAVDGVELDTTGFENHDSSIDSFLIRLAAQLPPGGVTTDAIDPGEQVRGGWEGELGDVFLYDDNAFSTVMQYHVTGLALKYGRTLDVDISYQIGKDVEVYPAGTSYTERIFGIFRSDEDGLHQARSRSVEEGSVLTLRTGVEVEGSGGFAQDKASVVMGDNGGELTFEPTALQLPDRGSELARMRRVWRMEVSDNVGTFHLSAPASAAGLEPRVNAMVLSDSEDFSSNLTLLRVVDVDAQTKAVALSGLAKGTYYLSFGQVSALTQPSP